jgi:hypothetical protein
MAQKRAQSTITFHAGSYVTMAPEERAIRDEIEMVAARYRVWGLKKDREHLVRLLEQRGA